MARQLAELGLEVPTDAVALPPELTDEAERLNRVVSLGRLGSFRVNRRLHARGWGDVSPTVPLSDVLLADLKEAIARRFPLNRESEGTSDLQRELDEHAAIRVRSIGRICEASR